MKISIVSPIYKGQSMLHELVDRVEKAVESITEDYEIILVNDSSPDDSWLVMKSISEKDHRVKSVNLSRNFGQHYAISAGLSLCSGDWIVVMDCDLQDVPEEIPNLYRKAMEGWDIVYARRAERKDGFFKRLSSTVFHAFYGWMSGSKKDKTIANFGIFGKKVIDEYNRMGEVARSFGTLIGYLGFRKTAIDVRHSERAEGKSSYTLVKLLRLTFDVIISTSNKPLRMAVSLGFGMSAVAFLLAVYNIVAKLAGIISVDGYTTTVFSIWFVGGILLMMMGVLGLYIGKIFDQVKGRPIFVISEVINRKGA